MTVAQHVYNTLFPYCAEVCVVTQYHRKGATPGGWGGHASIFLNGAEIDPGAGYPRLRLVGNEATLSDADSGTGVSVNQVFANVTWVAIPGRAEFFRGGVAPDQTLDEVTYDAAVGRASRAAWFAGVRIKDALVRQKPAAMPYAEFVVRHSIGTDFAVSFARTAYCARLPMNERAMGRIVAYLNAVNESAQAHGYTWNPYTNNCSHVVHNALAAAGVWDPKEERGPGWINVLKDVFSVAKCVVSGRMSDLSFPANNFVRAYEAGNERPIDDASAAFLDHDLVRTMNEGWTSTVAGSLIATYPMHDPERNTLFAAGRDPFLFSIPVLWDKEEKFKKLTRRPPPSLTDLGANLAAFRDRYARILDGRRDPHDEPPTVDSQGDDDFQLFRERLYGHVAKELEATKRRIAEYERMTG